MAQLNMNPIQWHEGMLLMPQHFQQADMRAEGLLTYYMSHMFSFCWGVVQVKIDEPLLTSGVFRLLELETIMPDGLLITGLPTSRTPLEVDLFPLREKLEVEPYFVYLCIPRSNGDWTDVGGDLPRYVSGVSNNVADINTGEQSIEVPRLIPNLSLQVGQEPPAHYVSLPLAQVSYNTKSFSLTPYIPPQIQVGLMSDLGQECNKLIQDLREKLGYLQQKVQAVSNNNTKGVFFEEMESARLKLVLGLMPFEVALSTGKAQPFEIYKVLYNLAAHVSGIKFGEIPPRFKGYNHLDIGGSFAEVIEYIRKVLDSIQESYTVVPFTLNERAFTLQLQSAWIGDRFVLGAQAQPGMTDDTLLNWISNCVIVTDKYISLAKDNRVLGASRLVVSEVPSMNLVSLRGIKLFVVEAEPRYIDPTGVLCLFNMSDNDETRPASIVLYNAKQGELAE